MYDLKKVIETNTNEGVVDYEKVMSTLDNDYVNPIVAKKTDKEKITTEAIEVIVKELGIEGNSVDDLKLYVKKMGGSTDEVKEENLTLTKELEKIKKELATEVELRTTNEEAAKDVAQTEAIKSLGITDEKQIEFFKWDFNKQVTDDKDFDTVVKEYAKENEVTITTAKFIKDDFGKGGSDKELDITEAWKAKRAKTHKK